MFNQEACTLTSVGAAKLDLRRGTFNFEGDNATGTVIVRNSALNLGAGATSAVEFIARGIGTISGDVAAAQTLWVQGSTPGSHTTLTASQGFTNAGTIRLESINSSFRSDLTVSTGTLTNTGAITVGQGTGGTRAIRAELINNGTVNVGKSLTVGRSGAYHVNSGTFTITSSGAVVTFTTDSGTFVNASAGTIGGVGRLNVSGVTFSNNGTVGPGLSAGVLNFTGNYTQGGGGTFDVEIGGIYTGTEFDRLNISGQATLDGTLNITLIDGFTPTLGDTFVILNSGSISGVFTTVTDLDIVGGLHFEVSYGSTSVTLTVVP